MTKIKKLSGIVCGGIVIGLAILGLLLPDRTFSPNENRNLAKFPAFSASSFEDGVFFKDLGTWLADQFPFRDFFVSLKSTEDYLIGRRESHGVYIGKDNYLFADTKTPDKKKLDATASALTAFSAKYPDLAIRMMVVPCAAAILPDHLPACAPVNNQIRDISDFCAALPASIKRIDPTNILMQNRYYDVYYRTDHHWTSFGARTVFDGVASELGIEIPITEYDHKVLSYSFLGTLASQSGRCGTRDKIDIYVPKTDTLYYVSIADEGFSQSSLYVKEKLAEKDQYQVFLGGNHPLVEIKTSAETGRNLLLFKDSYANSFVQFLIPYYDKIIMIDPRYYYDNVSSIISSSSITDVLLLYSANTLFEDSSLADCLNSSMMTELPAIIGEDGTETTNA